MRIVGKVLLKIFVYLFMENNRYMLQSKMVYCLIETVCWVLTTLSPRLRTRQGICTVCPGRTTTLAGVCSKYGCSRKGGSLCLIRALLGKPVTLITRINITLNVYLMFQYIMNFRRVFHEHNHYFSMTNYCLMLLGS